MNFYCKYNRNGSGKCLGKFLKFIKLNLLVVKLDLFICFLIYNRNGSGNC